MKIVINIQTDKKVLDSSAEEMSLLLRGVIKELQKATKPMNETNINFCVRD